MNFSNRYPLISNILECYLRPDVDSYNLIITIHFIMKDSPAAMAEGLMKEFKVITEDNNLNESEILIEFNKEIPAINQLMTKENIHQVLNTLYEYVVYLYNIENFKGADKWSNSQ
jgi:hypothetical protein